MTISKEQQDAWIAEVLRLQRAGQSWAVTLDSAALLTLVSQVQLACRHPGNVGSSRQAVEEWVRQLTAYVAETSPAFAAMLEAGWNPAYDEERDEPGSGREGSG